MSSITITTSHSILIKRPREVVWDFTQDFVHRMKWDRSVIEATVVQSSPAPVVKVKLRGGIALTYHYKLFDRPRRTSLVATDITSKQIETAGGSWSYEDLDGATLWTQTNSIGFRKNFLLMLFTPGLRLALGLSTRIAMRKAKRLLEGNAFVS